MASPHEAWFDVVSVARATTTSGPNSGASSCPPCGRIRSVARGGSSIKESVSYTRAHAEGLGLPLPSMLHQASGQPGGTYLFQS